MKTLTVFVVVLLLVVLGGLLVVVPLMNAAQQGVGKVVAGLGAAPSPAMLALTRFDAGEITADEAMAVDGVTVDAVEHWCAENAPVGKMIAVCEDLK